MIQPYSERLEQHSWLIKRLLINFRTGDEELLCSILNDLSDTKLSLRYCDVDLLFSYLVQVLPERPSYLVVALLLNLKTIVTRASCDLIIKSYRQASEVGLADENYKKLVRLILKNRQKADCNKPR